MMIKRFIMSGIVAVILTASSGVFADCTGAITACWQYCKIDGVDHMVCARTVLGRLDACKARNGQIQPATSKCGFGLNCNGCEN